MPTPARLDAVIERLRRARLFTRPFLIGLTPVEWFWSPSTYTTHIAWQVGHLAVAQYNFCLRRLRGRTAEDAARYDVDSARFFVLEDMNDRLAEWGSPRRISGEEDEARG